MGPAPAPLELPPASIGPSIGPSIAPSIAPSGPGDAVRARAPLVLVVAGAELTRARLIEGLVDAGWLVVGAGCGADAIERAADHEPDAIVVDLLLPDRCGLDVVRAVRGDALGAEPPIVGLAAHRPEPYRRLAEDAGCTAFLPSDTDVVTLALVLGALLDGAAARRGAA